MWRTPYILIRNLGFALRCLVACLVQTPQVVVVMHIGFLPLATLFKRLFRFRLVLWLHGMEAWCCDEQGQHGIQVVDAFICSSQLTKQRSASWRPPGTSCTVIYPTVDFERFFPASKNQVLSHQVGLSLDAKVVLTVGRLSASEAYKGQDAIVRSLPEVMKAHPNVHYLIAGGGDDKERLVSLASHVGVSDRVHFLGKVPSSELPDLYRLADVFAMPSQGEGFGIVYLEALGCGCRVVAGRFDGGAEALLGGRLGFLVDPSDPANVATGLIEALDTPNNPALRDSAVARFGRERFQAEILGTLAKHI